MTKKSSKEEIYQYLDVLRESGVTNMFGAAPYLGRAFGFEKKESHEWLSRWMNDFGKDDDDDEEE